MNQPDQALAKKIVGYLNEGARNIDPTAAQQLLAARKVALSRFQVEAKPVRIWAWATQGVGRGTDGTRFEAVQVLLTVLALVAALVGGMYWHNYHTQANELAEVDAGLLTDELPINAYLDKGFDSWLKRSSR